MRFTIVEMEASPDSAPLYAADKCTVAVSIVSGTSMLMLLLQSHGMPIPQQYHKVSQGVVLGGCGAACQGGGEAGGQGVTCIRAGASFR